MTQSWALRGSRDVRYKALSLRLLKKGTKGFHTN
jgi:hypothetical protein